MKDPVVLETTTFPGLTSLMFVLAIPMLSLAINRTAILAPAAPLIGLIGA